MLTGMYASETRFINFNTMAEQDAPDVKDMPTALRDAGYTTISNGKIYHSSADNVHSWDEVCGHDGGSIAGYACDYRTRPGSICCVWPHGMSSGRSSMQNLSSAKGHTKCPDDATCQEHDWENELDFSRTEKFVKWMEAIEQAKLAITTVPRDDGRGAMFAIADPKEYRDGKLDDGRQAAGVPVLLLPGGGDSAAAGEVSGDGSLRKKSSNSRQLLICPITHMMIRDPVSTSSGHTYEREAIEQWLRHQQAQGRPLSSPKTNEPLAHSHLIPNHQLRALIPEAHPENS